MTVWLCLKSVSWQLPAADRHPTKGSFLGMAASETIFPDCPFASSTHLPWPASHWSSFFHLVLVPFLLALLKLDTSDHPFGSLALLIIWFPFRSQFYLISLPNHGFWTCFNLQIRVLDALFLPCSPGAYACKRDLQRANSLVVMGASFLADWKMPQFPKLSPLLSLSAALQCLSIGLH